MSGTPLWAEFNGVFAKTTEIEHTVDIRESCGEVTQDLLLIKL